jgi:hypothetical protein
VNIDTYLLDAAGDTVAYGYAVSDSNPETYSLQDVFGVTLQPGAVYYVAMTPWEGDAGESSYTVELEWQSP